ncbi:MAK10-like protein [Tanacetum coccineum]
MGDENPIRTLGHYSKPSHKGYRNIIELSVGNNVLPLRSDTIRLGKKEPTFISIFPSRSSYNWLERLPAGSITTWEDLTTQFLAQFFLLGRTAKLRNDILMFQQHHRESLSKAWTRFKDLLQKVPHNGIDLWLQDLTLYDNESWNDPRDFAKPIKAIALPQDVPSTSDRRLIELKNQVQRLMEAYLASTQPTQVNKITSSCEICSGPHNAHDCMEGPEHTCVDYASSRTNEMGGKRLNPNQGPRNFNDATDTWKNKPNLTRGELKHSQTHKTDQSPSTPPQDDMIGKINLFWKIVSEKLNDVSTPENAGNSMAHKSIAAISHDEREELIKNRIKIPSKLFSPKYLSPASIKEINKNLSALKRVHFVNSIVILSTDSDIEEEDISSTIAYEHELGNMVRRGKEVKEKGKEEDEMETDVEVEEVIKEEESRFKTNEEVKEIFKEEEEDEDDENFNSFPTIKELLHHEWLLKNPRPHGFAYECDFMILEDTTSIIDRHLGEMVFGRPFIDETDLVYNKEEEGTVMFEQDDEKITFKMPHTIEIFKQTRLMGAIPINFKSNMWESEDLIKKPINWDKPPKNGYGAWHAKIRLIDPNGEEFTKTLQSIPITRKLSERESTREIIDLDHFYDM